MKVGSKTSIFREYYVQTALGVSSVINLLPTIGVVGPHRLQSLYGIDITEPNLLLMMQHRAVLFGLVGGILGGSIWWKQWRPLSFAAGLLSMGSYMLLGYSSSPSLKDFNAHIQRVFWIDAVGVVVLGSAAVLSISSPQQSEGEKSI